MAGESENFQSCLQTVVDLRSKTANAIKAASDGTHARHGSESEGKEKKFLSELKLTMDVVNSQIKSVFMLVYKSVNSMNVFLSESWRRKQTKTNSQSTLFP